jgi:hypothetical protein
MAKSKAVAAAIILPRPWGETAEFLQYREKVLQLLDGLQINAKEFDPNSYVGTCSISIRKPRPDEISFVESKVFRGGIKHSIILEISSHDFSLTAIGKQIRLYNEGRIDPKEVPALSRYGAAMSLGSILNGCLSIWNICYFGCLNSIYHIAAVDETVTDFGDRCEFRTLWAASEEPKMADIYT